MLNKKNSRWLRKVQMLMVTCHLREMVTWIHRKRITDLTAFHLWMVRYFDPLIPNICLCLLLLLRSSLFLATPASPQTLWSLSKDVFEQHTSTGSKAFSHLICLDAYNKFVWLSIFTLIETICKKFTGTTTAHERQKVHFWLICVA